MDLLKLFQTEIPITKALGIYDVQYQNDQLSLKAALEVNINHKGTFFGGTMYSCAALAAYGLFLSGLRERNYFTNNIVVSEGKFNYLKPDVLCGKFSGDFVAFL